MDPNERCRCRIRYMRFSHPSLHLCGVACPIPAHGASELAYAFDLAANSEPLQLRLF